MRYLVSFMLNEIKQKKRGKRRKSEGKSNFTFDAIGCIVCQDPKRNWIRVRIVACINRDERKKGRRDKGYEGAAIKGRKTERNVADKNRSWSTEEARTRKTRRFPYLRFFPCPFRAIEERTLSQSSCLRKFVSMRAVLIGYISDNVDDR